MYCYHLVVRIKNWMSRPHFLIFGFFDSECIMLNIPFLFNILVININC